jgi:hypothetical protein
MKNILAATVALTSLSTMAACHTAEPLFVLQASAERALENGTTTNQGIPEGLSAAILWRAGCNGCQGGAPEDLRAKLGLQLVDILGSFPDDFTIEFNESPPASLMGDEPELAYVTGVLVLTDRIEPMEYERDPEFLEIGFVHPLLFSEDAAALGIVSMTPIYVSFVGSDRVYIVDYNMADGGEPAPHPNPLARFNTPNANLAPGYHVARHNGVAINAGARRHACLHRDDVRAATDACWDEAAASTGDAWDEALECGHAIEIAACGIEPDADSSIRVLLANDRIELTIGGEEDLLNAFSGLTLDDLR